MAVSPPMVQVRPRVPPWAFVAPSVISYTACSQVSFLMGMDFIAAMRSWALGFAFCFSSIRAVAGSDGMR